MLGNNQLASGSADKTIKIWDVTSGKCVRTLEGHKHAVVSLQVLGNNQLASGSGDCDIKIWDVTSGKCQETHSGHTGEVNALSSITI